MIGQRHTGVGRVDLWLAGTMRPNAEHQRRLSARSVRLEDTASVVEEARSAGLYEIARVTVQTLVNFFGPPAFRSAERLSYELSLWPEHDYEWVFDAKGRIVHSSFRRHARELPVRSTPSEASASLFRAGYHTEADVYHALGSAQAEQAWWPENCLVYFLPAERQLVFTFEHGLLSSANVEAQRGTSEGGASARAQSPFDR